MSLMGSGAARPQHGAGGAVTSCKSLSEELLLILSSFPSPCRDEERRTSVTTDPGTLFAS